MLADPRLKSARTILQTGLSVLTADIPNMNTNSYRNTSSPRSVPYETDTVALEKQLENVGVELLEIN